ncbi:MAG: type III-B CRISPR-associated protein Cas10/Cmr2 [Candidatus Hydrothermae bacterium]|nr:type III-B CRISPR-associated protein Cas10/Cmr2 [Candidatus Hydrothermae bacterium]
MPDSIFWLRKIAAFLHDPPFKVWYFGKIQGGQKWKRDKDVIEIYESYVASEYPFKDPNSPHKIKFRKFHHVAASAGKNNYFGINGQNVIFDKGGYSFIHPLSGEILSLDEFWRAAPEPSFDPKAELQAFLKNLTGDEKHKFLTLWRLLPSRLSVWINLLPIDTVLPDNTTRDLDVIQSALITTWDDSIPLDRPDSLKPSFLILEFGPVQSFIANARKTRDLWFSSWLISYLAWKAMKPIAEELGPDNIVYPDLYKQPLVDDWMEKEGVFSDEQWDKEQLRLPTLPNTFLAIIPEGREEEYADDAEQALNDAWGKIVNGVYDLLTGAEVFEEGSGIEQEFRRQTEDIPFDIYWLALKWGVNPDKAIEDYKKLLSPDRCWEFERLWKQIQDKVKNTNIGDAYALLVEMTRIGLKALKYRGKPKIAYEPGHKCSLCGERTALTDGNPNDIKQMKKFWKQMSEIFPGHIKENEHLCAVCLVKRLAPKAIYSDPNKYFETEDLGFDYHFPSTGSVSIAPFIYKAINAEKNDLPEVQWKVISDKINEIRRKHKGPEFLEKYLLHGRSVPKIRRSFRGGLEFLNEFEPEWLYPETPEREVIEPERQQNKQEFTSFAEELRDAIKSALGKFAEKVHMPKYYAAVYLDGDHLGKWLSGEFAPRIEDVFHPDFVNAVASNPDFQKIKDKKRPVTPAIHRAISSALRDFALKIVPYVVEDNLGVVIYSGGDDALFLMPLENLFKTLVALRKLYSSERFAAEFSGCKFESNKGFIKIYENNKFKEIVRVMGTKATLSAGVAIAHYLDPLDITLSKAKAALEDAKNDGRNKAGFRVILRSGSERKAVVPWSFVEVMERFRNEVAKGFSSRFLRTLYRNVDVYQEIPDAFDTEFLKFGARGQSENAKSFLCDLIDTRKDNELPFKEFLDALIIADFVVREEGKK